VILQNTSLFRKYKYPL